jgi:uncharacterized OB-fold protein
MTLAGRGTLLSSTVVHLHPDQARPPPFAIARIMLADGPVVRTLLVDPDGEVPPGTAMVTRLIAVAMKDDGDNVLDLRFAPEG